jgi:hypothetical protein
MRTIPNAARTSFFNQDGGFSAPVLIEIMHGVAGYPNPLRLVNNNVSLVYLSNTYEAFPFRFDPPDVKDQGEIAHARITVCTVDQRIAAILRSTSTPPTVKAIAMYYSDETGSTVFEPLASWDFTLRNVSGNMEAVSADLIYEDRLDIECPADEFRPTTFPGLF